MDSEVMVIVYLGTAKQLSKGNDIPYSKSSTLDIVRQPNLKHSVHLIHKYIDYVL